MPRTNPNSIYLTSSWRNRIQQVVLRILRDLGHKVYDFREPEPGKRGFNWSTIDEGWLGWHVEAFREALKHPIAQAGFQSDFKAMQAADCCVLVLPCGRSAHLEAGWFCGQGKEVHILSMEACEPELMYAMTTRIHGSIEQLIAEFEIEPKITG